MNPQEELYRLRKEAKKLRQEKANLIRSKNSHETRGTLDAKHIASLKTKNKQLVAENTELKKEVDDLKIKLGLEIEKAKKYAGMIFKTNTRHAPSGKKRGAKNGHPGHRRAQPKHIDREVRVFLSVCPDCHTPLARTDSHDSRIVEDIPVAETEVTRYEIERQWCTHCTHEVVGVPRNTLPGFSIGLNAVVCILFLKYRLRTPLGRIAEYLSSQHHLTLTQGGIERILHACKDQFGHEYERILTEIRHAPVKHGDETSWRILGENGWAWLFSTHRAAYYTIEETRGKGVPAVVLGTAPPGLLVRDDCPSYFSLAMAQQSCWAHLLRVSRDETRKDACSEEMRLLHRELCIFFGELSTANTRPFMKEERVQAHAGFLARIDAIIGRAYKERDALAVQTRIRNQREHLIEALLHENAPLTNNHAERMIRPLVITRKISGGSQSNAGAATHAVNMSIMQTLSLRGISFFEGVRAIIAAGNPRYAGNG